MYRDYKTQIGFSPILQCTGTIKHRLTCLLSYSVQGPYIEIPTHDIPLAYVFPLCMVWKKSKRLCNLFRLISTERLTLSLCAAKMSNYQVINEKHKSLLLVFFFIFPPPKHFNGSSPHKNRKRNINRILYKIAHSKNSNNSISPVCFVVCCRVSFSRANKRQVVGVQTVNHEIFT